MLVKSYDLPSNRKLEIHTDETPENPRDYDNNGIMICFHKRYNLGDEHNYKSCDFSSLEEIEMQIRKDYDVATLLCLYLMDHSGLSITTDHNKFAICDPMHWDWGQVGFIFTTREHLKEMGHPDNVDIDEVEMWLLDEVKIYNQYLSGDTYGFQIKKLCEHCGNKTNTIESCWGFYGSDIFENGIIDVLSAEDADMLRKTIK